MILEDKLVISFPSFIRFWAIRGLIYLTEAEVLAKLNVQHCFRELNKYSIFRTIG